MTDLDITGSSVRNTSKLARRSAQTRFHAKRARKTEHLQDHDYSNRTFPYKNQKKTDRTSFERHILNEREKERDERHG